MDQRQVLSAGRVFRSLSAQPGPSVRRVCGESACGVWGASGAGGGLRLCSSAGGPPEQVLTSGQAWPKGLGRPHSLWDPMPTPGRLCQGRVLCLDEPCRPPSSPLGARWAPGLWLCLEGPHRAVPPQASRSRSSLEGRWAPRVCAAFSSCHQGGGDSSAPFGGTAGHTGVLLVTRRGLLPVRADSGSHSEPACAGSDREPSLAATGVCGEFWCPREGVIVDVLIQ